MAWYGRLGDIEGNLRDLGGPVIAHFGTRDLYADKSTAAAFEADMEKAGRIATLHWYEAGHSFATEGTSRYDETAANLAFARSLAFLRKYLTE